MSNIANVSFRPLRPRPTAHLLPPLFLLSRTGLKYEDLLVEVPDVEKALKRIPADVLEEREQRIKRAFDCSVKRKTLPYENQPAEPLDLYLGKELAAAQKDREERAILNNY